MYKTFTVYQIYFCHQIAVRMQSMKKFVLLSPHQYLLECCHFSKELIHQLKCINILLSTHLARIKGNLVVV
ncbi:unnamed protein product [Trifolium pratense]|uniref:Uncharacterized protein n=1 Tax=Trifolium pratense TaxID=57577 RepID=A0ACB0ITU7_TRIPR|nr:unnamed protein product [Trifolium pratense]